MQLKKFLISFYHGSTSQLKTFQNVKYAFMCAFKVTKDQILTIDLYAEYACPMKRNLVNLGVWDCAKLFLFHFPTSIAFLKTCLLFLPLTKNYILNAFGFRLL